jgi:hypothetical protein
VRNGDPRRPGRCRSTKVTTLTDPDQASELAHALTRLSEGAWDAAAWLDTYAAIEAAISELVHRLRDQADKIEDIRLVEDGSRHTDQWSFTDVKDLLTTGLPAVINTLARAQRLTVADELAGSILLPAGDTRTGGI